MPSMIDIPERIEDVDVHGLQEEQLQVYAAPPGFWHMVMQYVQRYRVRMSSRTPSSSHVSLHPTESPIARLAQEHPMLYLLGFCGIHSG